MKIARGDISPSEPAPARAATVFGNVRGSEASPTIGGDKNRGAADIGAGMTDFRIGRAAAILDAGK